uniref:Uncharacterized protein n=1 Tax=Anguilla anguilla TaxID=7936 RepID=A0A0E9Q2N3_ANGAN
MIELVISVVRVIELNCDSPCDCHYLSVYMVTRNYLPGKHAHPYSQILSFTIMPYL